MSRVLVIDDEGDICGLIRMALTRKGHEVFSALNGGDGVNSLESSAPDVVLLDMMLPDMSGADVARILRRQEKGKSVPIILMTGRDTSKDEIDRELFTDLLSKPFSIADLIAIVNRYSAT